MLVAEIAGLNYTENMIDIEQRLSRDGNTERPPTAAQLCAEAITTAVGNGEDGIMPVVAVEATMLKQGFSERSFNEGRKISGLHSHRVGFGKNSTVYLSVHDRERFDQIMDSRQPTDNGPEMPLDDAF